MAQNHLKSIRAPKTWPIERKNKAFVTRPNPGGHKMEACVPLNTLLQDMTGIAHTARGVRYILNTEEVLVNGKRKRRPDASAGIFDIISFPSTKTSYRIVVNKLNKLVAIPVGGKDAELVLSKITSKTLLPKKKLQLGFHNGRTLLVEKDEFKVGDTLVLIGNKVDSHFPLTKDACVFLISGGHVGQSGIVTKVSPTHVSIKIGEDKIVTKKENVIVLGKEKTAVKIE